MPRHVFAADLGGTKLSAAVIDRDGTIIRERTLLVDRSSSSAPVLQIRQLASELAGSRSPLQAFAAAAIAVPGLVRASGTVWAPNLPGWERIPLASKLKRFLRVPVVVESDRNAAVLGEAWRGQARGRSDVIVLLLGTGIGAGILSAGRLIRGAHELSGCAGWMAVAGTSGPEALRVGELESLAAGPGIARSALSLLPGNPSSELANIDATKLTALDVAEAARRGDNVARGVFEQAGRFLGLGVANLVSLFDPEVVVIGGGLAAASDLFLDALRAAVKERAQPLTAAKIKVVVSRLRGRANLLGTASLAWQAARSRA